MHFLVFAMGYFYTYYCLKSYRDLNENYFSYYVFTKDKLKEVLKMTLTDKETSVLKAVVENEYNGDDFEPVWTWSVSDNAGITGKEFSGVVASLTKKGYVSSWEYDKNEEVMALTDAGKEVYKGLVK